MFRHTSERNYHLIMLMKVTLTHLGLKKACEGFSLAHLRTSSCATSPGIGGLKVVCPEGARKRTWPGLESFRYVKMNLEDIWNLRSCNHYV